MSDDPVENVVERIDEDSGDDGSDPVGDEAEPGRDGFDVDDGTGSAGGATGRAEGVVGGDGDGDGDGEGDVGASAAEPPAAGNDPEAAGAAAGRPDRDARPLAARDLDDLTGPDRRLEPRVRYAWLLQSTIGAVVLGAVVGVAGAFLLDDAVLPGAAVFTVAFAAGAVMAFARYRRWRYRVREDSLFLDRGVLTQVRTVVPFVRIQHVDVSRGPVERALGLATVVVYTAGSRGADVAVPGLTPDRADDLQRRLEQLTIVAEGEDAV
jgi:membrane protein YdbS with pleckstrin-like domain